VGKQTEDEAGEKKGGFQMDLEPCSFVGNREIMLIGSSGILLYLNEK